MHDPVVAADGQTYERAWVERHFATWGLVSPHSRATLPHSALYRCVAMRSLMEGWATASSRDVLESFGAPELVLDRKQMQLLRSAADWIVAAGETPAHADKQTQTKFEL